MGHLTVGAGLAAADQVLRTVKNRMPAPPDGAAPVTAPLAGPVSPGAIKHGPRTGNRVALTFDDGPHPESTETILAELARRKITATFFLIGERVAAHPELARRIVAGGHEIGNHTYRHAKLTELPASRVEDEIRKTQDVCRNLLGFTPTWFRPPYGLMHRPQIEMAAAQGLQVALWDVDSRDWSQPAAAEIERAVLEGAQAGSIILCHDRPGNLVSRLGAILDHLQTRGLSFVHLSHLMNPAQLRDSSEYRGH